METKTTIPFHYNTFKQRAFFIEEHNLGWSDKDRDASISDIGKDDPLYYYMFVGIDIGFYYNGHKYWIESPSENLRSYGGEVWSLAKCDIHNPSWTGEYLADKCIGLSRHDAENRTELCHYEGVDLFLQNAKIDGKDLRTVLNESFITDL